jgi:hypothetical protein
MDHPASGRDWLRARRGLAFEIPPFIGTLVLIVLLAPLAENSLVDARVLYLACFALFSISALRFVGLAIELLEWDCPRCLERFCGQVPFRARCANCGYVPRDADAPTPPAGAGPLR